MITLLERETDNFNHLLNIEFVVNFNDTKILKEEIKSIYDIISDMIKKENSGEKVDYSSLANKYKNFYDVLLSACDYEVFFVFSTETKSKNVEKFFDVILSSKNEETKYNLSKKYADKVWLIKKIFSSLDNNFFKKLYEKMYDEYNKYFPKTFESGNRFIDLFVKYIYKTLDKNIMLNYYKDNAFKSVIIFALVFYSIQKQTPDVRLSLFFNKSYTLVDFNLVDTDVSEKSFSELKFNTKVKDVINNEVKD